MVMRRTGCRKAGREFIFWRGRTWCSSRACSPWAASFGENCGRSLCGRAGCKKWKIFKKALAFSIVTITVTEDGDEHAVFDSGACAGGAGLPVRQGDGLGRPGEEREHERELCAARAGEAVEGGAGG